MPDVNLSISQEIVAPIIEAKIAAAILSELQPVEKMMEAVVTRTLYMKVDENGKADGYRKDKTYIEWLTETAIKGAAVKAVQEAVGQLQPKLIKLIADSLQKQSHQIASDLVGFFVQTTKSYYQVSANVTFKKNTQ